MKLIIAGGRNYWLTRRDFAMLDALHAANPVTEEICGGALGADACGKVWAIMRGIPTNDFTADWKNLGRKAGPIRNGYMAAYADAVALFPGGDGTQDMADQAAVHGLRIFDFRK